MHHPLPCAQLFVLLKAGRELNAVRIVLSRQDNRQLVKVVPTSESQRVSLHILTLRPMLALKLCSAYGMQAPGHQGIPVSRDFMQGLRQGLIQY